MNDEQTTLLTMFMRWLRDYADYAIAVETLDELEMRALLTDFAAWLQEQAAA